MSGSESLAIETTVIHAFKPPDDPRNDSGGQKRCDQCNKVLKDMHTLRCHLKTVHGEKRFACPLCNKIFPHVGVLNAHKKTHSDTVYTCGTCRENFRDSAYFKKHVRAHRGGRPHKCTVCSRSYMQMSHLAAHMSLHTQARPFACDVCPKRFRLAGALKEHMNRHNNVRSHKCAQCDYATCYRKNLVVHVRTHVRDSQEERHRRRARATPCTPRQEAATMLGQPTERGSQQAAHKQQKGTPIILLLKLTTSREEMRTRAAEEKIAMRGSETTTSSQLVMVADQDNSSAFMTSLAVADESPDMADLAAMDAIPVVMETVDGPQLPRSVVSESALRKYSLSLGSLAARPLDDLQQAEVRPLDLSVATQLLRVPAPVPAIDREESSLPRVRQSSIPFSLEQEELAGESTTAGLTLGSPGLEQRFLSFPIDGAGRRRSVFLAEQLDFEHQAEMRVVDPTKVTG